MKSTPRVLLVSLLVIMSFGYVKGQLIINAGSDTILCESNEIGYILGGNPTVFGGSSPYTYTWSCEYVHRFGTSYASAFLNDTISANPEIVSRFDTLVFRLVVVDNDGLTGIDSLTLIASHFMLCLGECREEIFEGDSVQLYHCIMDGIPPYSYSWTPQESLSDPTFGGPWAKPTTTTNYILTLIDSAGCIATSSCRVHVFPTDIDEKLADNQDIRLYPNPARSNEYLTVEVKNPGNHKISICNLKGEILIDWILTEKRTKIELNKLSPGIFIYKVVRVGRIIDTGKLVVN